MAIITIDSRTIYKTIHCAIPNALNTYGLKINAYSIKGIAKKNNITALLLIPPIAPKLKIVRLVPSSFEKVDNMAFREYIDIKIPRK
jgi:hypothetical protein